MFEGSVCSGSHERQASRLGDTAVIASDCFLWGDFSGPPEKSQTVFSLEYISDSMWGSQTRQEAWRSQQPSVQNFTYRCCFPQPFLTMCCCFLLAWCAAGQRTLCFILSQVKTSRLFLYISWYFWIFLLLTTDYIFLGLLGQIPLISTFQLPNFGGC